MTVREIAEVCGGNLNGIPPEKEISNITIDSRSCDSNSLFIALCNNLTDNVCYISSALEKNAVILSQKEDIINQSITVHDTELAFRTLAKHCREKNAGKVTAITGSVGKTTVKELCVSILNNSGKIKLNHTEGNKNNTLGLPITLLKTENFDMTVLEAGISETGEMETLSEIARPDIAVITNAGKMHSDTLGTPFDIAKEKLKLAAHMNDNGILLVPSATEFPKELFPSGVSVLTVGKDEQCSIRTENVRQAVGGTVFDVAFDGEKLRELYVPIVGHHGAINGTFAAGVCKLLGAADDDIYNGLRNYTPCGDRQRIIKKGSLTVISDCYNAGPESMRSSLDAFEQIFDENGDEHSKKIFILGDMLELADSEKEHFNVGKIASELKPDILVACGRLSAYYIDGTVSSGFPVSQTARCCSVGDPSFIKILDRIRNETAVVLIKGSHGVRLEQAVKYLTE